MNLFESLDDLKPFIFRITDNGGATFDRFTIITCDGDYFGSSCRPAHPQGFGMWGEGIDVAGVEDRVEAGTERDLRWIDLPEEVRNCVFHGLNRGFADYLESGADGLPTDRESIDFGRGTNWSQYGIYKAPDGFRVAIEGEDADSDRGPYATFREAALNSLPEDYDLSGPEYHTSVNLWDESGGPRPLWDREEEPFLLISDHHDNTYHPDHESAQAAGEANGTPFEIVNLDDLDE